MIRLPTLKFPRLSLPILTDLADAGWPNWREAIKEVFIIALFSLMPVWLGLLLVTILTITDGSLNFLSKFASSSDLGILSAALLGPVLYMMFRDEGRLSGRGIVPQFPGGLWFTLVIIVCSVVATVIYCFTYLSGIGSFFDQHGIAVRFVDSHSVSFLSWTLFCISIVVVLFASTIRNSMYSRSPRLMSNDTQRFVEAVETAEQTAAAPAALMDNGAQILAEQLRARGDHESQS